MAVPETTRRVRRWASRQWSRAWAHRPRSWWHATRTVLGYLLGWAVIAVPVAYHSFMTTERPSVIAGHDVVVSPTQDGWATIDLGAFLPDVRYPTDNPLGVSIDVGATDLDNYNSLIQRYAVIASQPEGEIGKVNDLVHDMALDAIAFGALVGLAGPLMWVAVGRRRRRELASALRTRRGVAIATAGIVLLGLIVTRPFEATHTDASVEGSNQWEPISSVIPEARLSSQAERLEVQGGLITEGTETLIQSGFDTYDESVTFYKDLEERSADLAPRLHQPEEGETVALFVTDRHDNVGMDKVARAIGDAGGATILFDGGDDTSTGEEWEAFSLDSLTTTFDEYDARYGVAGNHDNGPFVSEYLTDRGFTMLTGEPIDAAAGIRLLGAPDPRSSGLGSWKTITGISFDELAEAVGDTACEADADGERVTTLLVHDANLGGPALDRGCVDLVLAGHLHSQVGPSDVTGSNGLVGTTYTNGTTGGAAYAFALGSKLRREAEVALITYRDGRPVGIQPIMIRIGGDFEVGDFISVPRASDDPND